MIFFITFYKRKIKDINRIKTYPPTSMRIPIKYLLTVSHVTFLDIDNPWPPGPIEGSRVREALLM